MAPVGSSVKQAGSSRNAPPASLANAEAGVGVVRVKNAKELRQAYIELNQAPDGADPDPLTLPKCVECGHCGWPVYPRDSKVATKKTFLRAGIERGNKSEEDAKRKAEKAEKGEEEDDEGSDDSRDTVERMADEIEDLKDANAELEAKNQELEAKNEALSTELEETKVALAAAEERIEFLEEAELRWREKLSQARVEIDRLKQVLERAWTVAADREGGLVKTMLELREVRAQFEAYVRRRNFMLRNFEGRYVQKEQEEYKGIVLRMWRAEIIKQKWKNKCEDVEVRRQREVAELNVQVTCQREHVLSLRSERERLQLRLKQAGQRLLRRALGSDSWPSAKDHAFRALVAMHPVNALENSLEFCQAELERTNNELEAMTLKNEALEEELDEVKKERDRLGKELAEVSAELQWLKDQIGSLDELERKRREQEEKERQHKLEIEAWKKRLKDLEEAFAEEREALETQIRMLQTKLALAEDAAGNKGDDTDDDPSRVVPKGQGVLCVGCLKQLVHRAVKPLPPKGALLETDARLEKAKKKFFEKELQGSLDPNDELHSQAFKSKKDPYGVARLTLQPPAAITSPSAPNLMSPTTGLPALRKKGFAGSATDFRARMREFQPRNFR